MNNKSVLVVEDDEDICNILKFNLENAGYCTCIVHSAEEALEMNLTEYDLIILDVMMGKISGFRLARMLQENQETKAIPFIFMTAKISINDRLTGFNLGAEDYIIKPFSVHELLARINVIFRRRDETKTMIEGVLSYKNLEIHLNNMKVFIDKLEVNLTKKEFEILKYFLENQNCLLTRNQILDRVWCNEDNIVIRTIDVYITRLRQKIEPYHINIITKPGYGYCFNI